MSNTIKIEFECPEFNSELEINIVIRKDGEGVVETATTSYPDPKTIMTEKNKKETIEVQEKPKKVSKKKEKADQVVVGDNLDSEAKVTINTNSGNLMDLTF